MKYDEEGDGMTVGGRTLIARRVVPELVGAVKGTADANVAAGGLVLPGDKMQLDLELLCVWVAGIGGHENGPGVTTPGHEHLGGVVNLGELHRVSFGPTFGGFQRTRRSYLAANNSADAVRNMVDHTVNQGQVVGGSTNRANKEMPVAAACFEQVQVLVVDLETGRILDLGPERVGDGGGERLSGDGALGRCNGGPGEQGRESFPVYHLGG